MNPDYLPAANILRNPATYVVVLTGAGISAESGIPTFRGPEGYWTQGSKVYAPQEIATRKMFTREPETVWQWYLHRLHACHGAAPNAGHMAVAAMEKQLGDRFTLITQNIDNLHLVAGNTAERTCQIHGNINFTRCIRPCSDTLLPLPEVDPDTDPEMLHWHLTCPGCGDWLRPHVLWFDEFYDEEWYRSETALRRAQEADILIVAGTSGATNLPNRIVLTAVEKRIPIIDINIEPSPFSEPARRSPGGGFLRQSCSGALAALSGIVKGD